MNITWIIGNGFDINLGLKTGYQDFLDNCYFKDPDEHGYRKRLQEACAGIRGLEKAEHWSDLEALLGQSSQGYGDDEAATFHHTFQEMQMLFTDYAHREELRLPEELPPECIKEFKESVCDFGKRMVPADGKYFGWGSVREQIRYDFISLNYTSTLDKFIAASITKDNIISSHTAGNTYNGLLGTVLHLHGSIDSNGAARDIIFGVSDTNQIKNDVFAKNAGFTKIWVKEQKNSAHYGNNSVERAETLINDSQIICIFGCSLGESDEYLWRKVGTKLGKDSHCRLVLFVHGIPDRHGHDAFEYEQKLEEGLESFRAVSGVSSEDFGSITNRITVARSEEYFHMDALKNALGVSEV